MARTHWFLGTESVGLELFGTVDRAAADELAGIPFAFQEDGEGRVRASILAITIDDLVPLRIPLLRMSYPEVVWLLHLRTESGGGRLAICAHTRRAMVPALALLDRYAAVAADIAIDPARALSVHAGGAALAVSLRPGEAGEAPLIDRLFSRAGNGTVFEIPWAAHRPERTAQLTVEVEERGLVDDVFGRSFRFEERGLAYYGRRHACSPAVALRGR